METLVLHPEELFDKAAKGLATPDELKRLEAHVAECTTCRFERQVRMDFDAIGGTTADLDDLVARALSGAKAAAPEAPRRRRVGPLLIAAAVALMGFGSFAAVAQFAGVLPKLFETRAEEPQPAPVVPRKVQAPRPAPPSEPAVSDEGRSLDFARDERVETPPPPVVVAERPRVAPRAISVPARKEEVENAPLPEPPVVQAEGAAEVFARATQARVRGEAAEAIRVFREVVARFPASPEAALSQAQLGRLLLDRGDATAALEAFDAYLASKDQALREEVQGARAMSLQALGRADEERTAWEAVLHDYPSGVYAPRARTRLESLTP